jgi:hypothetical protein
MLSIKITPLVLFLLLLVVLVISVLFSNTFLSKEGFISFKQSTNPLDGVNIPTYSKTARPYKLYDNLFIDPNNGNLIEVDSTGTNIDETGVSIINTYVVKRGDSQIITLPTQRQGTTVTPTDSDPSKISMVESENIFIYETKSNNTDKYTVFYISWNKDTYVHIIKKTPMPHSHVASYFLGNDKTIKINSYQRPFNLNGYNNFIKPTVLTSIEPLYSPTKVLYNIGQYVKYDDTNGNLIIQMFPDGNTKAITVFDRTGASKPVTTAASLGAISSTDSNFGSFLQTDILGQNLILYLANGANTIIALIGFTDNNKNSYTLNNVRRFPSSGVSTSTKPTSDTNIVNKDDSPMSEYFKWYWYWKNKSGGTTDQDSDKYLLKTQIVPPVCPSCPMCPSCHGSACTNCGGKGGSGTLTDGGNSIVRGDGMSYQGRPNSVGGVVNNTVDTAGGVVGAGLLGAGLVGAAAINTAGTAIGAAGDLAEEIVDDVTGLAKGAGSGIKDILTLRPTDVRKPVVINRTEGSFKSPYGTTTGTQSGDQYSYYGALPSKGDSNYIPVTADFSAFGR